MNVYWTRQASADLVRLYEFLSPNSPHAAARAVEALAKAPRRLERHPRAGPRIRHSGQAEMRRLIVDDYEIHYEVREHEIWVARIFHMREER